MSLFDEMLGKAFIIVMLAVMLSIIFIFIMHILMPKKVLKTYFKEPYFGPGEIALFTGFPFGYMRTTMFMRILGFPGSGKRRGVETAYKLAPVWYCKASKYFLVFFMPLIALMILLGVIVFIRFEAWK
ncbi:MAG: hypothetical protein L3J84_07575 [Gammaproteobacteria bacterium]|nr:hypothetical protein [Gammaproteobacteria bacterium]